MIVATASLLACSESEILGGFVVVRHGQGVTCSAETNSCVQLVDGLQQEITAAPKSGSGVVSRLASQFPNGGLLISFEFPIDSDVVGSFYADIHPSRLPERSIIRYEEIQSGVPAFVSQRVRGRIELPGSEHCPCQDGRLELIFSSPGADQTWDTADDQRRVLTSAQYTQNGRYCRSGRVLPTNDQVEVELLSCPVPGANGQADPTVIIPELDRYPLEEVVVEDQGGCGGDEPDSAAGSGCEGDAGDPTPAPDAGCEGDTGGDCDGAQSGGCDGSSGGTSCNPDLDCAGAATASVGPAWRQQTEKSATRRGSCPLRRRAKPVPFGTTPILLACLLIVTVIRRRRPRAPLLRCGAQGGSRSSAQSP
jgi:hypothetical protein